MLLSGLEPHSIWFDPLGSGSAPEALRKNVGGPTHVKSPGRRR